MRQVPPELARIHPQRVPKRSSTKSTVNPADYARPAQTRFEISDYGE